MRLLILIVVICTSPFACSESMNQYDYYQTNYDRRNNTETYAVYIIKGDKCLTVKSLKSGKTKRYCELGKTGLDLERDYPNVYIT